MGPITEIDLLGVFAVAGIPVLKKWQLVHSYISYQPDEDIETTKREALYRATRPSWLVKTPYGLIEMNLRKRVVDIRWDDTPARCKVTGDEVTKGEDFVHAYTLEKAAEYLVCLKRELDARVEGFANYDAKFDKMLADAKAEDDMQRLSEAEDKVEAGTWTGAHAPIASDPCNGCYLCKPDQFVRYRLSPRKTKVVAP